MAVSSWGQAIQIFGIKGVQAALLKHDFDVDSQILWTCKKNLMLQFLDFAKIIILMVWTLLPVPEARQFRCFALKTVMLHCSHMTWMLIPRCYEHAKISGAAISRFCENLDFECLNMAVSFWGQANQISCIEEIQAALLKHDFDVDSQILWT